MIERDAGTCACAYGCVWEFIYALAHVKNLCVIPVWMVGSPLCLYKGGLLTDQSSWRSGRCTSRLKRDISATCAIEGASAGASGVQKFGARILTTTCSLPYFRFDPDLSSSASSARACFHHQVQSTRAGIQCTAQCSHLGEEDCRLSVCGKLPQKVEAHIQLAQ